MTSNKISHKSKLIFCALSALLPSTGLNWLYLKGIRSPWFVLQLLALILGIMGWMALANHQMGSTLGWIFVSIGFIGLLSSWLTCITFGLRPDEKWDAQFNPNSLKKSNSGWLVILCVIASLMLGAFVLMAGLAIAFEQFFAWQIEEARKISQ